MKEAGLLMILQEMLKLIDFFWKFTFPFILQFSRMRFFGLLMTLGLIVMKNFADIRNKCCLIP